jgi:hypothetical protein
VIAAVAALAGSVYSSREAYKLQAFIGEQTEKINRLSKPKRSNGSRVKKPRSLRNSSRSMRIDVPKTSADMRHNDKKRNTKNR